MLVTATVKRAKPATGQAVGTVTFSDNGVPIGTVVVSAGKAKLSLSALAIGTHPITADYSGDTNDLPGSSAAPLVITVTT